MVHRVAMIAFPEAQLLDVVGPLEVFSRAARLISSEGQRGELPYAVEIVAPKAGPVRMSSGLDVFAARGFASVKGGVDTLFAGGGHGIDGALADGKIARFLTRMAPRVKRLASVCTGAFLLAQAGLLDGRRATTHWAYTEELAARHPAIEVDGDPIFIREGRIYTSAGVTAGMDLALAMVEDDHGPELAREVARQLVMFVHRPGGQSQFSVQLGHQLANREPLAELQAWIVDHLDEDLSITALAHRAGMSPRNFARVFVREIGTTPGDYIERLRVEAARRTLEQSSDGVHEIADRHGFGTAETMRRAFARQLRVAPSAYRARFQPRALS